MLQNGQMSRRIKIYSLGALVGVFSGLAAVLFRYMILGFSSLFVIIPAVIGVYGWIVIPILGAVIVALMIVRFAPEAKGHGIPEVMESYVLQGGKMRVRIPLLNSFASTISIGSGGSCGREGPIAQIGASVGTVIADKLQLDKKDTKTLLLCGFSAGTAATFNAPLGGALFGIEILAGGILGFSILPVILASVVATAIADFILGDAVSFIVVGFTLGHPIELVFYLILGIILGFVSIIWMKSFYRIQDLIEKIRVSKYALPAIGGLLTGLVALGALFFEQLFAYEGAFGTDPFYPAIMGVGYAFIDATLTGSVVLGALLVFGVLKMIATSFTLGSGGAGGIFTPTLFVGAAFGGALGLIFSYFVPGLVPESSAITFALVGMAALFAGSAHAPITCIVMIMEMTQDYFLILPLMIAVSASYLVSALIEEESIYTMKLARRGVQIKRGTHIGALKSITVREIMTVNPTILTPEMPVSEVFKIIDETHHTKFPVIIEERRVVGILIAEDLFHNPKREDGSENLVSDLMNPDFLHLLPGCTMDGALQAMMQRDEGHAVIVDPMKPEFMLGYITKADVLKAYEIAILRLQKQGIDVEDITPAEVFKMSN